MCVVLRPPASLRRARQIVTDSPRSPEELVTEPARGRVHTSVEPLDDRWPYNGAPKNLVSGCRPAPALRRAPACADARPRHASRETATPDGRRAISRRTPQGAKGNTESLAGPIIRSFDPKTIRRPPRRLEITRQSEDHLVNSRTCVRAPGPHRSHPQRRDAPKDEEAREVNASRPCGPLSVGPELALRPRRTTGRARHSPRSPRSSSNASQ